MFDQLNDITTIAGAAIGGGGIGFLLNNAIQKFIPNKKENTDIKEQQITIDGKQVNFFIDINKELNKVVKQLQDIACYREPCNKRLNGKNNEN